LSLFTAIHAQTLDRSIRPKAGPAPEIHLGDAETFTLDNGLKVFVVENHKMPIVTYSIQLDIRPETEGDKVGTYDFVGELLTHGTEKRNKDQFDQEMDEIGANIGAGSNAIFGQSLSKFQGQLLDLMSDALMHAQFKQTELDKLKKQTKSGLATQENDPDAMLQNVSGVLNFGKNHPYGEITTEQTVENVTLSDCNKYYHTYFRPNVAYMAVVGDITVAEAKKMVQQYFGAWERADVPKTNYPAVVPPAKTTVDFVSRPGAVQSVIAITYPVALQPGAPDVIKVRAMNEILGGSSQGRLFLNLREKHAWTYGAYSRINPDDIMGTAQLYAKCRNVVTDSSIDQMLIEMNRLRTEPVDQQILQNTLNYMSGTFALGLESPQTIAQYAINIERYNMPKDYYKNYLKNVSAVNVSEIQAMAEKYIHPQQAHIVVVGNQSEAAKLKKFSADEKLLYYDNYGNPVEAQESKVINGISIDDVLSKYINAIGGKAAIEGLKDLTVFGSMDMGGSAVRVIQIVASPDKLLQTVESNGNIMQKMIINGDKGYQEAQGQKQEISGDGLNEYKQEADLQADLHPEKYGISYSLNDMEKLDGKDVYNVFKASNNGKDRATQYYDVATGLLIKEISNSADRGLSIKMLSDDKEVKGGNGYKIPFTVETTEGGMDRKIEVQSARAN
ncbi:MAG TPA: pitrilysin family protein, partial [Arachidicoccus sp.]|nr:pitrilysin family protein [Arachidicoccus sp.]